jgi:hypothetical protein
VLHKKNVLRVIILETPEGLISLISHSCRNGSRFSEYHSWTIRAKAMDERILLVKNEYRPNSMH